MSVGGATVGLSCCVNVLYLGDLNNKHFPPQTPGGWKAVAKVSRGCFLLVPSSWLSPCGWLCSNDHYHYHNISSFSFTFSSSFGFSFSFETCFNVGQPSFELFASKGDPELLIFLSSHSKYSDGPSYLILTSSL